MDGFVGMNCSAVGLAAEERTSSMVMRLEVVARWLQVERRAKDALQGCCGPEEWAHNDGGSSGLLKMSRVDVVGGQEACSVILVVETQRGADRGEAVEWGPNMGEAGLSRCCRWMITPLC